MRLPLRRRSAPYAPQRRLPTHQRTDTGEWVEVLAPLSPVNMAVRTRSGVLMAVPARLLREKR